MEARSFILQEFFHFLAFGGGLFGIHQGFDGLEVALASVLQGGKGKVRKARLVGVESFVNTVDEEVLERGVPNLCHQGSLAVVSFVQPTVVGQQTTKDEALGGGEGVESDDGGGDGEVGDLEVRRPVFGEAKTRIDLPEKVDEAS